MIIVTNAAGGLNSDYSVGDITLLNDVRLFSSKRCEYISDFHSTYS